MNRLASAVFVFAFALAFLGRAWPQDSFSGVDLLYPELAHPEKDAEEAISRGDLRFMAVDRYRRDTPGANQYGRLKGVHGAKFVKHPFRLFPSSSQMFSFNIRARAYAEAYNHVLLRRMLQE